MASKSKFSLHEILGGILNNVAPKVDAYIEEYVRSNELDIDTANYDRAKLALELSVEHVTSPEFAINIASKFLEVASNLCEQIPSHQTAYVSNVPLNAIAAPFRQAKKYKGVQDVISQYKRQVEQFRENYQRVDFIEQQIVSMNIALDDRNKSIQFLDEKLQGIQRMLENSASPLETKYAEAERVFNENIDHINTKRKEVDQITSSVGATVIAKEYSSRAVIEEKAANWCRGGALLFMMLSSSVAAYAFYHAVIDFELKSSILRLAFAFLISVPAAYLATESAKHRKQQYENLQTSLDIHAIDPYISSLPLKIQFRLKRDMAARIFVEKNFDHLVRSPYPINLQESINNLTSILKKKDDESKKKSSVKKAKEKGSKAKEKPSDDDD